MIGSEVLNGTALTMEHLQYRKVPFNHLLRGELISSVVPPLLWFVAAPLPAPLADCVVTAAPPVGWVDVSFEPPPDVVVFPFEVPTPDGEVLLVPLVLFPGGCVVFPD